MMRTNEMVDIYRSWEAILQSKLSDVDHIVRLMFRDMRISGVNKEMSELFMQEKFLELVKKITGGGCDAEPD